MSRSRWYRFMAIMGMLIIALFLANVLVFGIKLAIMVCAIATIVVGICGLIKEWKS